MVMDNEPFRDLHYILQDINDDRIWVYAEWVRLPACQLLTDNVHEMGEPAVMSLLRDGLSNRCTKASH